MGRSNPGFFQGAGPRSSVARGPAAAPSSVVEVSVRWRHGRANVFFELDPVFVNNGVLFLRTLRHTIYSLII